MQHRSILLFDNIQSTATTQAISLQGARACTLWASASFHVDLVLIRAQVSSDGIVWGNYNKLISNVTNTNSQNLTRVLNLPFSADGIDFASFSPEDTLLYVRFTGGGGTLTAYLEVEDIH